MRASIIGLGETGRMWDGKGFSIGVNDAFRFGKPTSALVCVNVFKSNPERHRIVSESRPKEGFYSSNTRMWINHPDYRPLTEKPMKRFTGKYEKGEIYYAKTSTFIAMCLAVRLGYTEIVIYGCDLVSHKIIKGRSLESEVSDTKKLVEELEKCGVKVYLAKAFGAFKEIIPALNK
jgi:hypothetical protein